jgi:RHS repeat-associated protein
VSSARIGPEAAPIVFWHRTGQRWHYVSLGDRLIARLSFDNSSADLGTVLGASGAIWSFASRLNRQVPMVYAYLLTGAMLILLVVGLRRRPAWRTVAAVLSCYAVLLATSSCGHEVNRNRKFLEVSGTRLYFHQGVAAGPALITDGSGTIREERRFEPFGQPINGTLNKTVDPTNNLNKETNPDTGWSYHGARWMSPQTARWQTPDPPVKGPKPQLMVAPWSAHPYQYANQSPALFWDPDGNNVVPPPSPAAQMQERMDEYHQAHRDYHDEGLREPLPGPGPLEVPLLGNPLVELSKIERRGVYRSGILDDPVMYIGPQVVFSIGRGLTAVAGRTLLMWERLMILDRYMQLAGSVDVSTAWGRAIVWSGGRNKLLAEAFAARNARLGYQTLELTRGGAWFEAQGLMAKASPISASRANMIWERLSVRFIEEASGNLTGFVKDARPGKMFLKSEYPAFLRNPNLNALIELGE